MEPRPALTETTNRAVIKTFYFTSLFVDKGIKEHYSPKMDIRAVTADTTTAVKAQMPSRSAPTGYSLSNSPNSVVS